MRRLCQFLTVILSTLALAPPGFGQSYPSRPITLIVPYAPGGSVDAVARVIATKLGDRLGQSIVVENVAGAGGVTGTQRAARAEPDGYTLLFSVESTMAIAKLVQPGTVQYDSQKDFQPITMIGSSPLVLVGNNSLPARNLAELIALLRANPGKYSYATSGVGTSLHVAGEMINIEGKVRMQHVPYRVGAQIVTDMMGNHVDLAVLPLVMALPAHRAGNVRIFAITEPARSPLAPDLPSIAEQPELKNVNVTVWFGLFAPARVSIAIANRLQQAVGDVIKEPETRAKLQAANLLVVGSTPSEFAAFLAKEIEKYSAIVKAANIKAE
ncbi:MAG: tripartite tricarboxylate transporter substrate binding protein [Xanthobacteraceae bacterium]|nr:tripartite tricarboxylate transporter substrate binding protein [Xanthobacteraceae bacterium]